MATKVYLRRSNTLTGVGTPGLSVTDPAGNESQTVLGLSTSKGAGVGTVTQVTPSGPTNGYALGPSGSNAYFVSPPLAAAVTISGTVTNNIWGLESSMNANASFRVTVKRLTSTGAIGATVSDTQSTSELGTSAAVRNWTDAAPTSTAFAIGDRILVILSTDDAGGTMGSGFTITANIDGPTDGANGDSYVQFNENFSFMSAPAGSTYYLTDAASDLGGAGQKAASTSRGSGSTDAATTMSAGYAAPVQVTATAGGTALEWFTPQLNAFTLSGIVKFNARAKMSANQFTGAVRGEVAICNGDGSGASVWGAFGEDGTADSGTFTASIGSTSDTAQTIWVSGNDTSVTDGQRLRIRLYMDDAVGSVNGTPTGTVSYSGTSGGAAGDTFVVLPQSVTEFTAGFAPPFSFQGINSNPLR